MEKLIISTFHRGHLRNEDIPKNTDYTNQMHKMSKRMEEIMDEEKRNSDEIYNLKNNKIPVALPIVDSYYIN